MSESNMNQQIRELLKRAVSVAHWRGSDFETEDGSFATTDIDQMIFLEEAIQKAFDLEASEIAAIFKKIKEL